MTILWAKTEMFLLRVNNTVLQKTREADEEWQSKPCNFQPSVSMFFLSQNHFINTLISTSTQPSTGNFDTQGKAHMKVKRDFQVVLYKFSFLPQSFWVKNKIEKILKPGETSVVHTDCTREYTEQLL